MGRVGQNHLYTVASWVGWPEPCINGAYAVFLQGNHQIYGHIRCVYTVMANPTHGCLLYQPCRGQPLVCMVPAARQALHILFACCACVVQQPDAALGSLSCSLHTAADRACRRCALR
jgi:hypothetical protein